MRGGNRIAASFAEALCQKKERSNEHAKTHGRESRQALRRESSCAKRSIISGKASTARGPRSRPLPLVYQKPGALALNCVRPKKERLPRRRVPRRNATTPKGKVEPKPSHRPSDHAPLKRL